MSTYTFTTLTVLTLTTAGTPQTIVGSATLVARAIFQSDADNTGSIFLFQNGKASTDGIELTPGSIYELNLYQDSQDIDKLDLNTLRFDGDTTGNKLRVSYITA